MTLTDALVIMFYAVALLAIGLQEQVANHRKRLGSKALVVSDAEKVS